MKITKIFLGYVHPGYIPHTFLDCLLDQLMTPGLSVTVQAVESGPLIAKARNTLLRQFLNTKCEYFLSVDTDIVWKPSDLLALVKANKDIVGAVYLDEHSSLPVYTIQDSEGKLKSGLDPQVGAKKLIEVAGLGMGFTLIRYKVIADLGVGVLWPFAETLSDGQAWGEDVTFCARAREAGYEIFLDPTTKVGHRKVKVI